MDRIDGVRELPKIEIPMQFESPDPPDPPVVSPMHSGASISLADPDPGGDPDPERGLSKPTLAFLRGFGKPP